MPSTTSPNNGLELQATGENDGTWGTKANANLSILDLNLGGRNNKSVAGAANVDLTTAEARSVYQHYTGTLTGNIDVTTPAGRAGFFWIKNATSGAFTLTFKPLGGTGVVIPQGETRLVFIDPDQTSVVFATPFIVSGGGLEFSSSALRRSALTGDVTAAAGANATVLGITTTRGDIIRRGAAANERLSLGANNTILSSDGTDTLFRTLTALMDAVLGTTDGMVAKRGAAVWAGATTISVRNTPRIGTVASSATPTPDADAVDQYNVTAQGEAAAFGAPTGTPTDGQKLTIRVKDNGTARALSFNAAYRAGTDAALPTTTVLGKTLYLGFIWNAADSKWDFVAKVDNI